MKFGSHWVIDFSSQNSLLSAQTALQDLGYVGFQLDDSEDCGSSEDKNEQNLKTIRAALKETFYKPVGRDSPDLTSQRSEKS